MISRVNTTYVSFTTIPATGVAFDDHEYYHEAGYSGYPPYMLHVTTEYSSFRKKDCNNVRACAHFEPSTTTIPLPDKFLAVSYQGSRPKLLKDVAKVHFTTSESMVLTIVVPKTFASNVLPYVSESYPTVSKHWLASHDFLYSHRRSTPKMGSL